MLKFLVVTPADCKSVENPERYEQSKDKVQEKREEEFIRYK